MEAERGQNVQPVFVVGSARNGTTWLCNLIAEHPQVTAAQHQAHWGFHESNLYKNHRFFGDLTMLDRWIVFRELYSRSDHFRLSGCRIDVLEAAWERGDIRDFYDAFFVLMDNWAARSETYHWMTKLDPLFLVYPAALRTFLNRVNERYPNARFVVIRRRLAPVIQSYLNMEGRSQQQRTKRSRAPLFAAFETARYLVHYATARRITRSLDARALSYEALKANPPDTLQEVLKYCGLHADVAGFQAGTSRFKPNSSLQYRGTPRRLGMLGRFLLVGLVVPLLVVVWPITVAGLRWRERLRSPRPPLYFKLIKLERYQGRFREELLANDERSLAQALFSQETSS